ncbi:MAG TPA: hypothetical protein VEY30_00075 [Myxococcaceae bacterium]|nr:hypothetical protein [Myxococcaceae bacterium]
MRIALAVCSCLLLSAASAAAPKKRSSRGTAPSVAVIKFQGPGAEAVRKAVAQGLTKRKVKVVTGKKVDATVTRARSSSDYTEAASSLGVGCVVSGTVKGGRARPVVVRLYNGADGQLLEQVSTKAPGKKGLAALQKALAAKFRGALASCRPAATEGDAPVASAQPEDAAPEASAEAPAEDSGGKTGGAAALPTAEADKDADAEAESGKDDDSKKSDSRLSEPTEGDHATLDVAVGVGGFSRRLRYADDLFNALSKYTLPFWPVGILSADWYPVAHFQDEGFLTNLGLTASLGFSPGITSSTANGSEFKTTASSFFIGPQYRLLLGASELTFSAAYGGQSFKFNPATPEAVKPLLPDVAYSFLRIAAGGRFALSEDIALGGHLGYLLVTGTGELGSETYFPNVGGAAAELGLFGSYALSETLDVRLGIDLRRYFFSMNPEVGDPVIAGGATDQYVSFTAGLGLRLP